MNTLKEQNLKSDIGYALSNFALIFTYSLCCAAALGQGLVVVLFSSLVCCILSYLYKNSLFYADPLLLVALIFVYWKDSTLQSVTSIIFGAVLFAVFKKRFSGISVSKAVIKTLKIALALCATVLFTNLYFGIGSQGNTPVQMLKSYISLGFHPHFTGLLTGTITLFMMITYPFKFKKLNKYLPAEFISLAVPFAINILLNPEKEMTTVNEAHFFRPLLSTDFLRLFSYDGNLQGLIFKTVIGGLLFAFCFFIIFYEHPEKKALRLAFPQITAAVFSFLPVNSKKSHSVALHVSIISAVLCFAACVCLPSLLCRIPLHSVGALLIVSSWQKALKREAE